MQVEDFPMVSVNQWTNQSTQLSVYKQKVRFIPLSRDFIFKQTVTFVPRKYLLAVHGQLIFNNGLVVHISTTHYTLFDRVLNSALSPNKVIFAIDQTPQTLVFNSKVNGLLSQDLITKQLTQIQKQVRSKKSNILALLAVIGLPIDTENKVMRQILACKKQLKTRLENIISKEHTEKKRNIKKESEMELQGQAKPIKLVKIFGEGTDVIIKPYASKTQGQEGSKVKNKKAEGGYFTIQNQQYLITDKNLSISESKILCRKTLRQKRRNQEQSKQQNQKKMKKQLQLVSHIKNNQYFINYYHEAPIDKIDYLLMDYYQHSLQEYVYYSGDCLDTHTKIHLAQQVVEAVLILHQAGIVHRDIKPSNFLVEDSIDHPNCLQLKIIDFAESYSPHIKDYEGDYACSHPYSPLECSQKKFIGKQGDYSGIKNKEIDYWSVGMTIYEIFFRKLPLSFSRNFLSDISVSWKSQLLLAVNQRERYGLALVEEIVTIICIKMIKYEQSKRMDLTTAMQILKLLEEYTKEVINIVEYPQ